MAAGVGSLTITIAWTTLDVQDLLLPPCRQKRSKWMLSSPPETMGVGNVDPYITKEGNAHYCAIDGPLRQQVHPHLPRTAKDPPEGEEESPLPKYMGQELRLLPLPPLPSPRGLRQLTIPNQMTTLSNIESPSHPIIGKGCIQSGRIYKRNWKRHNLVVGNKSWIMPMSQ